MNLSEKKRKQHAGHYEIQGETIAKFEFFDQGFNPYSRYLDIDKVDLILRRREGDDIRYTEVQVKYGRLFECGPKWEKALFDVTSWRFFKPNEFAEAHSNLFVAYVFSHPGTTGYQGDIFIYPARIFDQIINQGIKCQTKKGVQIKVYIARLKADKSRWFLWKKRNFLDLHPDNVVEVSDYRRNFNFDKPESSSNTNVD